MYKCEKCGKDLGGQAVLEKVAKGIWAILCVYCTALLDEHVRVEVLKWLGREITGSLPRWT